MVGNGQRSTHALLTALPLPDLMSLHTALATVIAPATPSSLRSTRPAAGMFGWLMSPPLVGWMVVLAAASAMGFILTLSNTGATAKWNWLFGAALGAAFSGLLTAHDYVKNRTFERRYNSVYAIRFVLGVIAGLILASLGGVVSANETVKALGRGVIALLGGFSAEGVSQILKRLLDIIITTVNGSGADAAKAQQDQLKAMLSTQLSDVLSDPNVPQALRDKLKGVQDKLK
jgi:hypothetical protein